MTDVAVLTPDPADPTYSTLWPGVLLGLSRGLSLAEAGALGSLAASEVIAHWGPRPMVGLKGLAVQHGLSL